MTSLSLSFKERIGRTRSQQVRALDAAGQVQSRPESKTAGKAKGHNESRPAPQQTSGLTEYLNLLNEFSELIPVAVRLYRYEEEDVKFMRSIVSTQNAGALQELKAVVRQWRNDAIVFGCDKEMADDGSEPLMSYGLITRARIQFHIDIMGVTVDENGKKYTAGQLDWIPSTVTENITAKERPAPIVADDFADDIVEDFSGGFVEDFIEEPSEYPADDISIASVDVPAQAPKPLRRRKP